MAGSFNNWDPKQHQMSDNPGSGHCKITLVLPPGCHEYKFVVNGERRADPNCDALAPTQDQVRIALDDNDSVSVR